MCYLILKKESYQPDIAMSLHLTGKMVLCNLVKNVLRLLSVFVLLFWGEIDWKRISPFQLEAELQSMVNGVFSGNVKLCFFYSLVSAPTMLFRSICWLWNALVQMEQGQKLRLSCLWSSIFIRTRRLQKPLMGQEAVSYCLTSGSQKWDTLDRVCSVPLPTAGQSLKDTHCHTSVEASMNNVWSCSFALL